jgi:hypothetical protein
MTTLGEAVLRSSQALTGNIGSYSTQDDCPEVVLA